MRSLIIITLFFAVSIQSHAQTLKRTYYDILNTQKAEEYYVNAKGERHGKYKSYSSNGIIAEEANFKNGYLDGQYLKYSTSSGRQTLVSKETYKEDVLHGEAVYYNGNGLVYRKGSYIEGKKQGDWQFLDGWSLQDGESPPADAKYIKHIVTFKDDEISYNGKYTHHYHPSGKIQAEFNFSDGYKVGENKVYHPNGQLKEKALYDDNSYIKSFDSWYSNGNLQSSIQYDGQGNQVSRVGYTEDGEPDELML